MKKLFIYLIFILWGVSQLSSQPINNNRIRYNGCFPESSPVQKPGKINSPNNSAGSQFLGSMVHSTPAEGQFLRILILYVKFPDDVLVGNTMNGFAVWPNPNQLAPVNHYTNDFKFIDTAEGSPSVDFTERYRPYTISDYFSEMSLGQFDVIGDEYSVLLPLSSVEYRNMGFSSSEINEIAIKQAEQEYQIDFKRYNNWSLTEEGWTWTPGGGDKQADMIVMVYRRAPGYPEVNWFINASIPVSGISDLGLINNFLLDSTLVSSGSGVTCLSLMQNYSKMTQIMLHEMCHRYFFNHFEIGLMTGVEHSSFNFSPFERTLVNYTTPVKVNFPYPAATETYTLRDYVFTGDLLEIQLPADGEKYYIANHQKKSLYDGISRGGNNCWNINGVQQDPYCPDGKGLYVYHQMTPSRCNDLKDVNLVQADGRYNWYIDRMVPYFIRGFNFDIPLYERSDGNINGRSEFHQRLDSVFTNMQEVNDDPCSDHSDDYFVTYDWLGDGKDAYNIGYDEILSPYSNPPSNTCSGIASGVTIKLLNRDSVTGAITIKVYYDDNSALSELPPAKPKNLKVKKEIFEPGTGRFYPKLSWDKNREPDLTGTPKLQGRYNIYRGVFNSCSPDSTPVYELISSVPADSNTFIDSSFALYPEGGGLVNCTNFFRSLNYVISAVDLTELESLSSDRAIINGYTDRCDDSILTGITHNQLPLKFEVFNYPNPFNPATKINYSLPSDAFVSVKIYNITGQEIFTAVNNEFRAAGRYSFNFDGTNLPSGVYFYVYKAGDFVESKKMILIK